MMKKRMYRAHIIAPDETKRFKHMDKKKRKAYRESQQLANELVGIINSAQRTESKR